MFGDYKTPIVADPGDEVQIILELTDNRTLERIADSGTYTNFLHRPNDMNLFMQIILMSMEKSVPHIMNGIMLERICFTIMIKQ